MNYNKCIVLDNITVSYENFGTRMIALNNISLNINKGEWIYIVGTNGSGKTTLLKSIAKQVEVDEGSIIIDENNLKDISIKDLSKKLFYVNQNPIAGTISQMTVMENLIATDNTNHRSNRKYYEDILEEVGLLEHKNQLVYFLSGGQRQILTLLMAKLRNSNIILLDEPLSSLDPANSALTLKILDEMSKNGKTILYVSHQNNIISTPNKRIIKLERGKIK